VNKNKTC